MVALLALVAALVAISAFDLARRPMFRRIALRSVARRKGEAVLVVVGSLLGTAIITSSFVVGDTLRASIRGQARTHLGPVDEAVRVSGVERLDDVRRLLEPPPEGVDGVLSLVLAGGAAATPVDRGPRLAEARATLVEVDFADARRFGGEPHTTGFDGAGGTPGEGEAVVTADLARALELSEGDGLDVFAYGSTLRVRVTGTVPTLGVAGFGDRGAEARSVFLRPGTLEALAGRGASGAPPSAFVLVSNTGGVYDGARLTDAVEARLDERLAGVEGVEVQTAKQDLLEEAESEGESLRQLFSTIGGFSVIAGILLLVNIFVMLAEERKVELGIMRAVGLRRNHLVRTFGMEGGIYAVAAACTGAVMGIGVGRAIVFVTAGIFNATEDERFRIDLTFSAEPGSVVTGLLIGLAISLVTVWGTSLRIGRLNVISAIRDLPDPPHRGRRMRSLVLATAGVVLGGLMFASGVRARAAVPVMLGPAAALFSAIPLLSRALPRRVAVTAPAALALLWGVTAFLVLPEVFEDPEIVLFVVQGVVTVAAAVSLATTNLDALTRVTDRMSGTARGLAARLGVAYPLAKRFRTGLLLGMFSIVIFTLTVLATFSQIFRAQAPRLTEDARAGFDVLVESSASNPPPAELLEEQPEVAAVAPLWWGFPKFDAAFVDEPMHWAISGFDERFLARGGPSLSSRDPAYATDLEAWHAVIADPTLVIVPDFFLQDGGGPPSGRLHVGEELTVVNHVTGEQRVLTVAGVVEGDWVFNGAMVSERTVGELLADVVAPNRHYVALATGVDPDDAAARLTGRLLAHGADAESIETLVRSGLSRQSGFFRLMEGFLSLGLVIGIAGLGVVMVRAVRERRRQIGMLRAMGFSAGVVRGAFLLEAGFVALVGVVVGVALGLVTSWSLLTRSAAFGDEPLPFSVPWLSLAVVVVVPLAASLLAAYAPAAQASRIRPAAALRIAE